MAGSRPEDAPEEVPNWYLFLQNRSIQQKQEMTTALVGIVVALQGVSMGATVNPAGYVYTVLGMLIFGHSMMKARSRDPETLSRRVLDRLGLGTWVDADAEIAEAQAITDGGEEA